MINQELIDDFLSQKSFAVAGSFRNETKYAYQIFSRLLDIGKQVFPLNPAILEVKGIKAYSDIEEIKSKIDVVCLVTQPVISLKIVKKCFALGIKRIWLQPGAESPEVLEFCSKNGMSVIHNVCILIKSNKKSK